METILVKAAGLALMIFAGYGLKRLGVFRTEDAKVISRIVVGRRRRQTEREKKNRPAGHSADGGRRGL